MNRAECLLCHQPLPRRGWWALSEWFLRRPFCMPCTEVVRHFDKTPKYKL